MPILIGGSSARKTEVRPTTAVAIEARAVAGMNGLLQSKRSAVERVRAIQVAQLAATRAHQSQLSHELSVVEAQQVAPTLVSPAMNVEEAAALIERTPLAGARPGTVERLRQQALLFLRVDAIHGGIVLRREVGTDVRRNSGAQIREDRGWQVGGHKIASKSKREDGL